MTRNISVPFLRKYNLPQYKITESTMKGKKKNSINILLGRHVCMTDILFTLIFKRILTFKVKSYNSNLKCIIEQFI